jgi:hypothetical protein
MDSSVPRWKIEGFRSGKPTGFERLVVGTEKKVRLLLERLAVRHLTDDEVTDATFGERTDLEIHWDYTAKMLTTNGTDYYYVARLETPNRSRPQR